MSIFRGKMKRRETDLKKTFFESTKVARLNYLKHMVKAKIEIKVNGKDEYVI